MRTRGKIFSKCISLLLLVCFVINFSYVDVKAATFEDLNQDAIFVKQQTNYTCTLAAAVMMVRRAALATGNTNWKSITESSMKPTAWNYDPDHEGLWYSFTYAGISVKHANLSGVEHLKTLLASHPEGIEIYTRSKPHAILITDYTNGQFYCADPGVSAKRIPVSQASITVESCTDYWYVSSPKVTLTASKYTIAFAGNGGTNIPAPITRTYGQNVTFPSQVPTKVGYEFGGWIYGSNGIDTSLTTNEIGGYSPGQIASSSISGNICWAANDCTYVATWKECTHSWDEGAITTFPNSTTAGVKTYKCTKCGKTKTESVAAKYIIAFAGNGGTNIPAAITRTYGQNVTFPTQVPKKEGYEFVGWMCGSDSRIDTTLTTTETGGYVAGQTADSSIRGNICWLLSDCTYVATWKKCTHSWDAGSITTFPNSTTAGVKTYKCTKCGETKTESVAQNYIIAFAGNGGTNIPAAITRTYGQNVTFPTQVPKKEGYEFVGWMCGSDSIIDTTLTTTETGGYVAGQTADSSVRGNICWLLSDCTYVATWKECKHSWDNGMIITQPTSTQLGEKTYTCTICNVKKNEKYAMELNISKQPVDRSAVDGSGKVYFSVLATGTSLTYQWYWRKNSTFEWMPYGEEGVSNTKLGIEAITSRNGFQYCCEIKDALGGVMRSSVATLTVTSKEEEINILEQPVNVTAKDGSGNVKFSVFAAGSGLTYQWYWRKNASAEWGISGSTGAKTANLTIGAISARNGFQYYCKITNAEGGTVNSDVATLTVTSPLAITKQPANVTAENGSGNVNFSVTAKGTGLTYQWYWRRNADSAWAAYTAANAANSTMSVGAITARNGFQYYCKIKDSVGTTVSSSVATLTVKEAFAITKQPTNVTAANGSGNVKISVTAKGTGLTYQWFWRKNSSAAWAAYTAAGVANSSMSVGAITARNGFQYYCLVKDSTGKTIASNVATLKIVESPFIIKQPTSVTAKNGGSTVKFNVEATGVGVTYQWYWRKNVFADWGISGSTGARTAILSIDPITARNGFQYFCVVKDSSGNITTTDVVTLTVTQ